MKAEQEPPSQARAAASPNRLHSYISLDETERIHS